MLSLKIHLGSFVLKFFKNESQNEWILFIWRHRLWFNELKECQNHPRINTCCFYKMPIPKRRCNNSNCLFIDSLEIFMMYFNADIFMMFILVLWYCKISTLKQLNEMQQIVSRQTCRKKKLHKLSFHQMDKKGEIKR